MKKLLRFVVVLLFLLGVELCFFWLISQWWGVVVTMVFVAIECVAALWMGYEMIGACDETDKHH